MGGIIDQIIPPYPSDMGGENTPIIPPCPPDLGGEFCSFWHYPPMWGDNMHPCTDPKLLPQFQNYYHRAKITTPGPSNATTVFKSTPWF